MAMRPLPCSLFASGLSTSNDFSTALSLSSSPLLLLLLLLEVLLVVVVVVVVVFVVATALACSATVGDSLVPHSDA